MNEFRRPSSWAVPSGETYFQQFVLQPRSHGEPAPKQDGYCRGNLHVALKYVRAWDLAIDCGAHIGYWGFDMAQRFAQVHAFEPSLPTYNCLVKNLAEFDNVTFHHMAVGDKPGRCDMREDKQRPGNTGSYFIAPGQGAIEIVTLDSFEFPACDLLKIDVEGFELRVLQGAKHLIAEYRPVISMECTDRKFAGRFPDIAPDSAQAWLLKRGYREAWAGRPDKIFVPA
jgi:FkbM family methyltransferase